MKFFIILAKVEMTGTRQTGKMVKRDMNWFPEVEAAPEARALVYSSIMDDLEKAQAYAAQEDWHCWVMPDSSDVLKRAREKALSLLPNPQSEPRRRPWKNGRQGGDWQSRG